MNLPNRLTISRIVLTFVFIVFLLYEGILPKLFALLTFIIASLTDYYDGKLAKKLNLVSDFGKLIDPVADKILVLGAFLRFLQMQLIPLWMVIVIVSREFLITGLRLFAFEKGKVISASRQAKHKTVSQIVAILSILVFLVLREILMKFSLWSQDLKVLFNLLIYVLMFITVILTTISGISYLWQNRRIIVRI